MSLAFQAHLRQRLTQCDVPTNLHEGLVNYISSRRPVGSFLMAVLENNLKEAVLRADPLTARGLRQLVLFLHNYAPAPCWGSPEAVEAWRSDPSPVPEIFE